MTTHPPALVRAVADAIVAVAKRYPVPSEFGEPAPWQRQLHYLGASNEQLAEAALDAVDAWRRARTVESHADAVHLVEDIIDAHVEPTQLITGLDASTGTAIVDALLGDPVATSRYDDAGNLIGIDLAWPSDETRACIVARPILEHLVELLTRPRPTGPT